ncbi:non-hydrolyzing UDP-N-acetylglucosamine 2-epimerase [Flavilitoribacter nigricans]|uniref:UDP-N-acetylglucosamine 2-epimerase (Non-hydrolyzing) n=1 Tax=Flavilitoribacter nigricans (strain ATCC 23147 / DSM 23189 / NBRC 102662 / NCIMB 1420 / SS-2) TaxID=1122177 RepID=A0A2D0N4Q1_FLAN2|nr:UDP-N-acetylglucosamine 2-epimerase (non-hydrolyzing) [Flavilitoribacter nigricans]PHN03491.1 UDP-N-acetylglucosamine 2-epimerase (non-hydrolyzing) [Flavilitoribacter nigricans DSM 23189 = NBRC 102662]
MKIISVVGARPNFMKIAPFIRALEVRRQTYGLELQHLLVHTGQHYDVRMSAAFFAALNIPEPDINLKVGSGSHAEQLGQTMIEFEKVLLAEKPDWVVVVGDVNATLACSVIAKRLHIKVAHIEAGLRSGDMRMPEEINRLVTDRLSDLLLTPDRMSSENLLREGVPAEKIRFVGNIMIDTLEANRDQAQELDLNAIVRQNRIEGQPDPVTGLRDGQFALMTMHRPSNVDHRQILMPIMDFLLTEVTADQPLVWPIHPRSKKQLQAFDCWEAVLQHPGVVLLEPLGYHEMMRLNLGARIMLTDSGGLQEECCVLGTPCLTLRWNTERPVTLREYGGASVLVGNNIERIRNEYLHTLSLEVAPSRPEYWDGAAASRMVEEILEREMVSR